MARATSSFAGAGFAGDQNRRIAAGDLRHLRQDGAQRGRAADNLFEHRGLVDFLAKRNVLLLQFFLVSLAILDVGPCDIPPDDLSLVVCERVVANQKPAIRSVAATQALLQLESAAGRQRTGKMCLDPVDVVRMNFSFMASLMPLLEADAVIGERHAIRIQPLEPGSQYADELGREVQHLAQLALALAQGLRQFRFFRHVHARPDEGLTHPPGRRGHADATNMTNRSIGAHDPFREIDCAMVCQHFVDFFRDELPIFRVYEGHVFRDRRRPAAGIEAVDQEQLGRPVVEAGRVECPAAGVRKPLPLRKVGLGLLVLFDIEVDPDPVLHRSIGRSERLGTAEEPAVIAFSVAKAKTHLTRKAGLQTIGPDSPRFLVIVRMEQGDMRVPRGTSVVAEAKRIILG